MNLTLTRKLGCMLLICTLTFLSAKAQVGINTTTPDGILDVNSTEHGIVLPRFFLNSTAVAAPVTNPQGGNLAVGTVVYNVNTTTTGTNDVVPGIYVWTGTEWFAKFTKKQAEFFTQTNYTRPTSSGGWEDITGLVNQSFTPKYTGTYKFEVSVNYGGGYVDNNSSDTDVLAQEAIFRFDFDETDYFIPIKCWSVDGDTRYYLIWEQASIIKYVHLTAGTSYSFDLHIDQQDSTGFVDDGNSGTGRGYTGYDIPCSVEFIYIGD